MDVMIYSKTGIPFIQRWVEPEMFAWLLKEKYEFNVATVLPQYSEIGLGVSK